MSDAITECSASPKVVKAKKEITSKIDSGLSKKSSMLTLIKTRQPSTVSRASSKQSNLNVVEKKPSNISTTRSRMATSFSSTRFSHSSKQNVVEKKPSNISTTRSRPATSLSSTRFSHSSKLNLVDDKVQQGVHQLGTLPSYLRGKRPATASSKLNLNLKTTESETGRKLDKGNEDSETAKKLGQLESLHSLKFKNNLAEQCGSYARTKDVLDGIEKKAPLKRDTGKKPNVLPARKMTNLEHEITIGCTETAQIDSGKQVGCPPCEGEGSGDAAMQEAVLLGKELELNEVHGKMKQLEEKCDRHEADCRQKQERISELEAEVATRTEKIKEREDDIKQLRRNVENLQLTSSSRDSIARDGLQEVEQKIDDLRKELAVKCNDLCKSNGKIYILNDRIEKLKIELVEAGSALEEKEKQIFESMEKETERDSIIEKQSKEIDASRQCSEELTQRINFLTQEIAEKDSLIAALKTGDPMKVAQTELEAHRMEVAALQEEVKKLRFENNMLVNVKKQDDVLLQIRSKLLENLERSKEAFKARCEEMSSYEGDGETGDASRARADGFDILFKTLAEKQRRCCKEEEIIGEIEQNNHKCKAHRSKLLEMLKRLKKENRQMREIMSNCGPETITEYYGEPTRDDSHLKGQVLDQICRLFPEEPALLEQTVEQDNAEEEITSRIIYNDQISGEDGQARNAESS